MKILNRRELLQATSGLAASSVLLNRAAFAEDMPMPKTKRFLLYIHFGSSCGVANGLIQPLTDGVWPSGFFAPRTAGQSANPLINKHIKAQKLVLHDYIKFLAPLASQMCLVNGNPVSLGHETASNLQRRGSATTNGTAEWAMAVAQFMRSESYRNPVLISSGSRSASVPNINNIQAPSLAVFKTVTTDVPGLRAESLNPIWKILSERLKTASINTTAIEPSFGLTAENQMNVLFKGLPELAAAQPSIDALTAQLASTQTDALISECADKAGIAAEMSSSFRDQLILAGALAKSGIGSGMSIGGIGEDLHSGGADVQTARRAAARWAQIHKFWQWVQAEGLQNDVMVVVGQEFARSPYNSNMLDFEIVNAQGAKQIISSPGRDHGLCMGYMFINANVPESGRIGFVGNNMTPLATKDAIGTIDTAGNAYLSENIVGSMLMRCFPELFPTERMVRAHWPTFKIIAPILA